jgi:hypothetical protein
VSAEYTVWTQHAICVLRFAFVCACVITLEFKVQTYNLFNTSYTWLLRVGSCVVMMGVFLAYCEVGVFYRITTAKLDDDVTKITYIGDFHGSISYLVNFCPFLSCMIVCCPTPTQRCFLTLVFAVFTVFELAFIAARSTEAEQCSHFWLEKYSNWTVGKLWIVGNMMVLLVILYIRICYKFAKVQYLGRISSCISVLGVMVLFGWMVVVGSTTYMLRDSYATIVSDSHRVTGPFAFSAKVSTIQEDVRYTEECRCPPHGGQTEQKATSQRPKSTESEVANNDSATKKPNKKKKPRKKHTDDDTLAAKTSPRKSPKGKFTRRKTYNKK